MEIKVLEDHKYFKKGKSYKLNDFTILTGKNGSGKTNFLRLLMNKNSRVSIDGAEKSTLEIEMYHHSRFTNPPESTREAIRSSSDSLLNRAWKAFNKYKSEGKKDEYSLQQFQNILKDTGKNIEELTETDFKDYPVSRSNETIKIFTLQFFKDTSSYLYYLNINRYNHFLNSEYNENNLTFSDEAFINKYGNPPWETLNRIFEDVHFKYRFIQPINLGGRTSLEFELYDLTQEIEVKIGDLSEGERTILRIICSIYDMTVANVIPDIFLFDEIDALLHPSYSKHVVNILNDYLVGELKRKVILVTHSPSTVAISPSESIFLCSRKNFTIKKVTKDIAIGNLTENLNSLSILHENRRQVFVEDKDDAYFYEFLYNKIKASLHIGISLSFIPISTARNEKSGGSHKVTSIVNTLSKFGNKQVFGIIDRDLSNQSNDHIFVPGFRHSIENYIFDPVFLLAYLLRENAIDKDKLGIKGDFRYFDLETLTSEDLQSLIDNFLSITGFIEYIGEDSIINYFDGKQIKISSRLFEVKGHLFEEHILKKIPKLKGRISVHNSFKYAIINDIIDELPGFISTDFLDLFKRIQKR